MDVGNYISELLAQKGEVSVPGLGYFAHTRVNGHYNEREGKFYPPTYSVQFDPQLVDDDTLAQYIADKKKISPASAKYFTEKYINSLKTQAAAEEAALADLGWFYMEQGRLFFSANSDQSIDPHFIGYEPVTLQKLGNASVVERTFAPTVPASPEPTPYTEPETIAVVPQEYPDRSEGLRVETDEEYEADLADAADRRKRRGGWILAICLIVFTAIAVFLVYRYDPKLFNLNSGKQASDTQDSVSNVRVEPVESIPAKDTTTTTKDTTQAVLKADTQANKPAAIAEKTEVAINSAVPVKDSIAGPRYEIMGGSFKDDKEANTAIGNYKKLGIEAHIVSDAPGKRKKVSLGTFKTRTEAETARKTLVANKKVNKDIYTLEIKPRL